VSLPLGCGRQELGRQEESYLQEDSSLASSGLDATRSKWENHWSSALSDDDFAWLTTQARCNMIRLPIGWFTLGPSFCQGTAFDGEPGQVYINAWAAVKDLVRRCHDHGIGVLLDLHAVPGGANGEIHSGTSSGKADLWGNQDNLDRGQRCLVFLAQEVAAGMPGVMGVQLCNEAMWAARGMYEWYDSVIAAINAVNSSVPIYISDSWDLSPALVYIQGKNKSVSNPIIVDTHKYYTFSASDQSQSPWQIIDRIPNELNELQGKQGNVFDNGAATVYVGEYSCVLSGSTWSKASPSDRPGLTKQFGQAQSRRWQQYGGCSFWTFKMDWMDGGDWGFKQQTNDGAVVPPGSLTLSAEDIKNRIRAAGDQHQRLQEAALREHTQYWDRTSPGQHFEHWRYANGWELGWNDAQYFLGAKAFGVIPGGGDGGDKIGCLDVWVQKRMRETGSMREQTPFGWEWEQGFRKGIADLYRTVGI
jgi:Cellulase (glycosyl hydrolase family 5)